MPDNKNILATCQFVSFRYRKDDFAVIVAEVIKTDLPEEEQVFEMGKNGTVVIAGTVPQSLNFARGTEFAVTGAWVDSKYGKQIKIKTITILDPQDSTSIENYLASGIIKGIGPALARRIVKHFGDDTLKILDEYPSRILEVHGIGENNSKTIMESWKDQRAKAALLMTLCSYGLSVNYATKALKIFGANAVKQIKENPYVLISIPGIGFLKADRVAREMGIKKDSVYRIKAGLLYCLREQTYSNGHCFLPEDILVEEAEKILQVGLGKIKEVLLSDYNETSKEALNGQAIWINRSFYLKNIYFAERFISEQIRKMAYSMPQKRPCLTEIDKVLLSKHSYLVEEQKNGIKNVFNARISIITGGPGTGKTLSINALLDVLDSMNLSYKLASPTGKAAKRLSEATCREATTIHRLLEFNRTGTFAKNKDNPIDADVVVIDETSMIDVPLMESLLSAISDNTSVVFIGDANQLPSVGPGAILKDMVKNNLCPIAEYRQIHRQALNSSIVKIAHNINTGSGIKGIEDKDFVFITAEDPLEAQKAIIEAVAENKQFTPDKIQVISPMKKGPIGTNEINRLLRDNLKGFYEKQVANRSVPFNGNVTSMPFRIGDKIIQVENNYNKEVFNGEIGYVVNINPEDYTISVTFDSKTVIYERDEFDQLEFAYALTVHRSQGSEFPCVIMPVHTQHYVMLYRNLLYTGVTRAKEMLILIGTQKALWIALKNTKQLARFTSLS